MSFTGDRRLPSRRSFASEQVSDTKTASDISTPKNVSPSPAGSSSRFNFFTASVFKGAAPTTPVAVPHDDELMNLDIESSLFPNGPGSQAFSPAAYKNLQQTATGLLQRYQSAYQQRTIAYHELKAERGAQDEEKEEAETKMHHLKMQLEDMARKAADQEAAMQSLMEELNREKKLRSEEHHHLRGANLLSPSEGSSVSEDLGAEEDQQRRLWRRSLGTVRSEAGFDTDDESIEEASVFSRSRSPTIATTITDISPTEPPTPHLKTPSLIASRAPRLPPPTTIPAPKPQMNTFQKLFKGISGDASNHVKVVSSCQNCEGQHASVAWDTVSLLKDENRGLKDRVGELETAVEGALDVANGIML